MSVLGSGLSEAGQHEDALIVYEAELSMLRRVGALEESMLVSQNNLAGAYRALGRHDEALHVKRDVYSGRLRLNGAEHGSTLIAANNYTFSLLDLQRFAEAKSLLLKSLPVARRVLGDNDETRLRMRWYYAVALYEDPATTLDGLREAVTTLQDVERPARRVFGGAHPLTVDIETCLRKARAVLRAREAPPGPGA